MIDIPLTDDFLARLKTECKLPSGWSWTIDSESHTALTSRFEMKEQRMTIKTVRLVNEQHIAFLLNGEPVQPVGLPSQFQTINLLEAVIVQFDALKVCNGVIGDNRCLKWPRIVQRWSGKTMPSKLTTAWALPMPKERFVESAVKCALI